MQSSGSSNSPAASAEHRRTQNHTAAAVWFLRIVTGAVFVFSGFVKAVDPWGTVFKLDDYFTAWHVTISNELTLILGCALAAFEFTVGVLIAVGAFRRTAPSLALAMMAVMLPLTAWIWATDPVSDCGCFGDALVLSNGATFAKNIVLTGLLVWLAIVDRRTPGIVSPRLQWMAVALSVVYCAVLCVYGYLVQPWIDFRPYAVGQPLVADSELADMDADTDTAGGGDYPQVMLIYSRGGVEKAFTADSLPGDDWQFVRRQEPAQSHSAHSAHAGAQLSVLDDYGDDVTAELAQESTLPGGLLLLTVSNPRAHGISRARMASHLGATMDNRAGAFAAIVATDDAQAWADRVGARYPVYTADDTDLKTLARGNAALVYVKDNRVRWKRALYSLPPDLGTESAPFDPERVTAPERSHAMRFATALYLVLMGILVLLTILHLHHTTKIRNFANRKQTDKSAPTDNPNINNQP